MSARKEADRYSAQAVNEIVRNQAVTARVRRVAAHGCENFVSDHDCLTFYPNFPSDWCPPCICLAILAEVYGDFGASEVRA